MLKRRALMESISSNLHNFLKKIGNNLSVPDKKFLRDSFTGLLRCGKYLLLASQGFATEKLTRKPLSLRKFLLDLRLGKYYNPVIVPKNTRVLQ